MTLQEKHNLEKNKMGMILGVVISAMILLFGLLAFLETQTIRLIIRDVFAVLIIVCIVAGFFKLKEKETYRHLLNICVFLLYMVMLFTNGIFYYYAFIFPISIMVMLFQDVKLVKIGAVCAIVSNIAYDVYFCLVVKPENGIGSEIFLQMGLIILSVVAALLLTSMQQRHVSENTEEIESHAAAQAQVAVEIVRHSNELGEQFTKAMEVSASLNECMNSSHESVNEIAQSTKLTAESIEQQTAQTYDIQQNIEKVEGETREMRNRSDETQKAVEEGVDLIDILKKQAEEVAKISYETEKTTQNLNESIREVEAITETILGISSQTNLLALNASIEAARAGEAGKGFAVVADEIRNLSEGTKEATEQISAIISRLTNDAEAAAQSMSRSAKYAEKQNDLISEAGKKLQSIQHNTEALHSGVNNVTVSVEEVLHANTAITDSISNLSATSEEVAASTESSLSLSASSMEAMAEMNGLLEKINQISNEMRELSK